MKNQELFNRTISILVKAYQNDTLKHGYCYACAVGNLVSHNMDIPYNKYMPYWDEVFFTSSDSKEQTFRIERYEGKAKVEIDSTGYTPYELAKIEYAFEMAEMGNSKDDYMFNGLMAVVDVLMEIHEASQEETQEAKLLFSKC